MSRKIFYFCVMLLLPALTVYNAVGQTNDVDMELEVKSLPDEYLFDETTMRTEEEALAESRNKLRSKIENETNLKNREVTWQSIISAIVDNAPYLVKPRGEMKRVLIYVKKDDLPVLIEKYKNSVSVPAFNKTTNISSQNSTIDATSDDEKIAMIKSHPNEYRFAEGTGSNRGNAQSNARLQLAPHIRRLIAIDYPSINATDVLIKEISDDTEVIAVRQGNIFNAFAYVNIKCLKYNLERGINSGRCDDELPPDTTSTANNQLEASTSSISFAENGEQKTFTITSGINWNVTRGGASWLTLSPAAGSGNATVVVAAAANKGTQRTATITISSSNVTAIEISVTQAAAGSILEVIMKAKTMNELYDILIPAKNNGKLVFGQVTSTADPDAYLVMYDNEGRIVNFYNPGSQGGRPGASAGRRLLWFKLFE